MEAPGYRYYGVEKPRFTIPSPMAERPRAGNSRVARLRPLNPMRHRLAVTRLEPMSADEFRDSFERAILRVAEENVRRGLWVAGMALEAARSEVNQLLPQGRDTPGFSFSKIVDETTNEKVGETWYAVDSKGGRAHFWVHWIMVEPPFRRRGYGRATLEELATMARGAGADRIGLHVLADNSDALGLYGALGYRPTSLRMARRLTQG